ncbi:MAG: dipeptidase [Gemmataceae bacterium]|nr:dipeptidase [Gemmataceae bacterium]
MTMDNPADPASPKRRAIILTDQARAIHREALLIDGHNDLPWELRTKDGPGFRHIDLRRPQKQFHTDIQRLKQGNVGAQFWSAYVPVSFARKGLAVKATLEQIDVIHELARRYPDVFAMAYSTADIRRIHQQGKIACLIGIEGGHAIDNSLELLRCYYRLGVRYMTLTHTESLDWADSCSDVPKAQGLSAFGAQVIREMNRLGMLVDLSHVSDATMKAALRVSKAPVIFSHSSARAVADHPRNVPDDVLRLLRDNGGIVMVNFYSGFIVPEGARATRRMFETLRELQRKYPDDEQRVREAYQQWAKQNDYPAGDVHTIVDHIDHIVRVAGIDHVGLGSDFDGVSKLPYQMHDVSCYPYLTQALLERGYSREQIHKILGGNLLRVFGAAEAVAARWPEGSTP